MSMHRRYRTMVLASLLLAEVLLVGTSGAIAEAVSVGQVQAVGGLATGGVLTSIDCSAPQGCTAVGTQFGQSSAKFWMDTTAGAWSSPSSFALPSHDPLIHAISCVDDTCTGVGMVTAGPGGGSALVADEVSGVWTITKVFSGIGTNGLFGSAQFLAVDCVSVVECTAVGQDGNGYAFFATEASGIWGAPTEIRGVGDRSSLSSISCSAPTECTAVGSDPGGLGAFYVSASGGGWGSPTGVLGQNSLFTSFTSVSCSSANNCMLVGNDSDTNSFFLSEVNGIWGTPTELTGIAAGGSQGKRGSGSGQQGGSLFGVSCPSPSLCIAVGADLSGNAMYITESDGNWADPVELGGAGITGTLRAVSCHGSTGCTAVGGNSDGAITVELPVPVAPSPSTTVTVAAAATQGLAATGVNVIIPTILALGLLGLGGVVLSRRRRGVRA